jgi:hypothetical protein
VNPTPSFASRAALKFADIEAICKESSLGPLISDQSENIVWCDAYGSRGGVSDYLAWRYRDKKEQNGFYISYQDMMQPDKDNFR